MMNSSLAKGLRNIISLSLTQGPETCGLHGKGFLTLRLLELLTHGKA